MKLRETLRNDLAWDWTILSVEEYSEVSLWARKQERGEGSSGSFMTPKPEPLGCGSVASTTSYLRLINTVEEALRRAGSERACLSDDDESNHLYGNNGLKKSSLIVALCGRCLLVNERRATDPHASRS
jgi:hypothetical protein